MTADTTVPPPAQHEGVRLLVISDIPEGSTRMRGLLGALPAHIDVQVTATLAGALARLGDGSYTATLVDLPPGADGWAVLTSLRDEQEVQRDLRRARGLLDALESPTCSVGADGQIVAVNKAWRSMTASNAGHLAGCGVGSSYLLACDRVAPDASDFQTATAVGAGLRKVLAGSLDHDEHEYPLHGPDGDRWFVVRTAPAPIDGLRGAVITHVDVTEMHNVQQALAHQALHDAMTGLPNRMLLTDRLSQALSEAARLGGPEVGVGFLDLDSFKRINDSLGHPAGDALLVQVADRLSRQLRPGDTLSRISGDEFVVVWRNLGRDDQVVELGRRLTAALDRPFDLGPATVTVTASVGVVVGQRSHSVEDLLAAADAAMYAAKSEGRGRVRVFTNELRWRAEELMDTEVGLRAALIRSQLVLHYQPVIDLASGRPVAVEALVRWQHPEQGLLGPTHFLRVAEQSGLIVPLGRWVLEQACHDAVGFEGAAAGLDVAVNLSVRQLTQPDAVAQVGDALEASGLDPRRLILEVTESAVVQDGEAAALALDALSALGVRIAIDDFGTGYSSLLYLRRYPINALKLDRTFVSGIGVSPDDEAICSSVLSLAHAVGATSVAEGVETVAQQAALRGYGCQQAQGFLWSPAVPIAELPAVLLACRDVPVPSRTRRTRAIAAPLDPAVAGRIASLHSSGASLHTIAAALNRAAVPNPAGVRWTANAVARHIAA